MSAPMLQLKGVSDLKFEQLGSQQSFTSYLISMFFGFQLLWQEAREKSP